MGKFNDLTFKKFGKLLCLQYLGKSRWLCRCDCGYEYVLLSYYLTSGKRVQCRFCYYKSTIKTVEYRKAFFNALRNLADSRNLEFNVTQDYLYKLFLRQERKCALSGVDICFSKTSDGHTHGETTASLDRIDSSKGYIIGNVQWVHKKLNCMKSDLTQERFISLCKKIRSLHLK